MLHILLLILKIIGWILLAILILAVLLIGVVLFVPFKYKAKGSCQGDISTLCGHIRFSWLLHLVGGYVKYENGSLTWKFRIAWKKFQDEAGEAKPGEADSESDTDSEGDTGSESDTDSESDTVSDGGTVSDSSAALSGGKEVSLIGTGDAKEAEQRRDQEKEAGKGEDIGNQDIDTEDTVAENARTVDTAAENARTEYTVTENARTEDTAAENARIEDTVTEDTTTEDAGSEDTGSEDTGSEDTNSEDMRKDGIFQRLISLFEKIRKRLEEICQKIKYTFHKIYVNIKILLHRKDKLLLFITDETHKSAFGTVLVEIRRLLKLLKPGHLKVNLCFGFSDPCTTGQVFALISILAPYVKGQKELLPDFEQKILKGTVAFSGKVRVLYGVLSFWRLLTNKKVRITYKHIRKFKL